MIVRVGVLVAAVAASTAAVAQPTAETTAATGSDDKPALALTGWAQVDSVAWSQDSEDQLDPATGDPLNQERFLVRRARVRASAERGPWSGAVEIDGNTVDGATARLLAAEVAWRAPTGPDVELELAGGLFKIPFGAEVPLPDRRRDFFEPSRAARALFPGNYDAGVEARGAWRFLRWTIAAMNGAPVADAQFTGRDPSHSFDFLGRVGVELGGCGWSVAAGFSALTGRGFSPGEPPTKDEIQWVDLNEDGLVGPLEITVIPGDPGLAASTFPHKALGFDAKVRWYAKWIGWGEAIAEIVGATNLDRGLYVADPQTFSRDLRELGWHVGAVQSVTDHALVGVRLDRYQPDRDAYEVEGTMLVGTDPTWTTLAVLAGYRRGDDSRVVVEYDHERNPLGRADDGSPTTRAADRVTVRAQVGF